MTLATIAAAAEQLTESCNNVRKRTARRSGSAASGSTACDSEGSSARPDKKARGNHTHAVQAQCGPGQLDESQQHTRAFPAEMLADLAGSTSAEVRRMNEDERALVHYKRRLRNRESAKRSRARRQATLGDIQAELEDLRQLTASLVDRCLHFARRNESQNLELDTLRKEKQLLESLLRSGSR